MTGRRSVLKRFSVSSLFVLVTLVAILLGWVRYEFARTHRETHALQSLEQAIGDGQMNVYYGHRFRSDDKHYKLPFVPQRSRKMEELLGIDPFRTVKRIAIYAVGNTFEYERNPEGDFNVKVTYVSGLKDDDVDLLLNFRQLDFLMLEGSPIGDAGAKKLQRLALLNELNVAGSKVTHDGVSFLSKLPNLTRLNLSNTEINDSALAALEGARLEWLCVEKTNLSKTAIEDFKRARPDCTVQR